MTKHVELPTDPAKKQKLQAIIKDCVMVKHQMQTIKEGLDESVDVTVKEFNLPKKLINKLINTAYKRNFETLQKEQEDFEYIYESIMLTSNSNDYDGE